MEGNPLIIRMGNYVEGKIPGRKNRRLKNLQRKSKLFSNKIRRLERKLGVCSSPSETSTSQSETCSSQDTNNVLITALLPAAKRRATKRLSLSNSSRSVVRKFHLDRKNLGLKSTSNLQKKVEKYFLRDDVSVVVPDIKKAKKGIRYRLASLQELHQRFQVDESVECSYVQFTRYVPEHVIKPKPEDWGTCLCMTCLNPELKLEAIRKNITTAVNLDMVKDQAHKEDVDNLIEQIKTSGKTFKYLEWTKVKEKGTGATVKATTYHYIIHSF